MVALEYFPEMNGLVLAAGGQPNEGLGIAAFFDLAKQAWRLLARELPMGGHSTFIEYNPVRKVVIFGGGSGSDSTSFHTLNGDGRISRMKKAAVSLGINSSCVTVDPVGGKYLVLHESNRFYEYDVEADAWTKLPGPVHLFSAGPATYSTIEASITTYGVNMFVYYNREDSKVWLYKHSAGPAGK